jgi:hypothetical protein
VAVTWQRTGSVNPRWLFGARSQLHSLAQAVAGVGRTLHTPKADDSHTSFTWSHELDALVQDPFDGITCGLRPRDLTVILTGAASAKMAMHGHTLDEAFAFLESHFGQKLRRPDAELPDYMVARGGKFDAVYPHLAELARYYSNAALVLASFGPVRCWPHHFDIATLLALGDDRTIGVGMSPGDATFNEPYYYVTPWPYPDPSRLGTLPRGRWNTRGWTGAVLPAKAMAQEMTVRTFLAHAVERSREALDA